VGAKAGAWGFKGCPNSDGCVVDVTGAAGVPNDDENREGADADDVGWLGGVKAKGCRAAGWGGANANPLVDGAG
jgi:hypothetical protein